MISSIFPSAKKTLWSAVIVGRGISFCSAYFWNKPRTPTENELRTLLEKEGMKPYLAVLERGESDDIHKNNNDETHIVLEGQIEFCAEGRMFTLKPGDRIDIKKGTPHTAKNLERGQSVMLCGNK